MQLELLLDLPRPGFGSSDPARDDDPARNPRVAGRGSGPTYALETTVRAVSTCVNSEGPATTPARPSASPRQRRHLAQPTFACPPSLGRVDVLTGQPAIELLGRLEAGRRRARRMPARRGPGCGLAVWL